MSTTGEQFVRLAKGVEIPPFDCADDDLNDFLRNDALLYTQQLLSVTYMMLDDDYVKWFYSVSNDKISIRDTESNIWNRFRRKQKFPSRKRLTSYPAVKIGRLGVHKDWQGRGVGSEVMNYIKYDFINMNKTGCRFITVDAYNNDKAKNYYLKNGFNFLHDSDAKEKTRLMLFDLYPFMESPFEN